MDLRRATTISFFSQFGSAFIIFLIFTLAARQLGGESFGTFVLFLAILNTVGVFVDFGIDGAVEKRISEGNGSNVLTSALIVKLGLIVIVSVFLLVFRRTLNAYIGTDLTIWIIIVLFTQQFARVFVKSLNGELRVGEAEFVLFMGKAMFAILGLIAIQVHSEVNSLIVSYWVGWIVVLAWAGIRQRTPLGTVRHDMLLSIYEYAKYNFIASVLSNRIYSWIDVLIIGIFLSSSAVAAYELAWRVAGVIMLLPRAIGIAIFPQFSDWAASGSLEKVENSLPTAFFGALFLVIPAIGGVYVLSEQLMNIIFGPEFVIASGALVVLTIGKIPEALNGISGRAISGLDKPRYSAIAGTVLVIINVVLNVILISYLARIGPKFGLIGAAIATVTSLLLTLFVSLYFLSRFISIRFPVSEIGISCLATVIMTITVYFVTTIVDIKNIFTLVAVISLGVGVYGLGVIWTNPVRNLIARLVKLG